MGAIDRKDVQGYAFEHGMFCLECVDPEQEDKAIETDIITSAEAAENDEGYYCDKCHKRIV